MSDMDFDLAEYDQVDEAKFFMSHKLGAEGSDQVRFSPLIVTLSSNSEQTNSGDDTNCENDFVFLPAERPPAPRNAEDEAKEAEIGAAAHPAEFAVSACERHPTNLSPARRDETPRKTGQPAGARTSHPLMAINPNASSGKNPFYNLHQMSPDTASSQAYQPFWMRPDSFVSKPLGLLESEPSGSSNPSHLSDLMHQIITKSDSIYIAIPCAYCHEPKACPPSDISAWLHHMNRAHNCKVCPICNKLVGLGPMRDLEIMRKHVVAHIDENWLEQSGSKANFSHGLQQQWFSAGRCNVKSPRSSGAAKR